MEQHQTTSMFSPVDIARSVCQPTYRQPTLACALDLVGTIVDAIARVTSRFAPADLNERTADRGVGRCC